MSGWRLFSLTADKHGAALASPLAVNWDASLPPGTDAALDHDGPVMMATCHAHEHPPAPRCGCGMYVCRTFAEVRKLARSIETPVREGVYAEVTVIPPVLPDLETDPAVWRFPCSYRAAGVHLVKIWIHPAHGEATTAALALRYKIPVTFFATGPRPVWEQGHP